MNKPAKVTKLKPMNTIEGLADALAKVVADSDFCGEGEIHIVLNGEDYEIEFYEYDPDDFPEEDPFDKKDREQQDLDDEADE